VAAAVRGDRDAVRTLWQEHRRWVAAILLAHKPRDIDLDDLLQDVAMTFVRTINTLRDDAVLRPWLRTVAINAARASGREERRRRLGMRWDRGAGQRTGDSGLSEPAASQSSVLSAQSSRESAGSLLSLSATLPDGYREPLLLKCLQGMSYREIGRVMNLPESTIETRIARARKMLRELATEGAETVLKYPGVGADHEPHAGNRKAST
jgi:RNA polymerase sigma-70 factor (ECF subfamily)